MRVGHPLTTAQLVDRVHNSLSIQTGRFQQTGCRSVLFTQDGKEEVFSGNVFILQFAGFLVGKVNDPLNSRGDKDLTRTATVNTGFRAGLQYIVQTLFEDLWIDLEDLKDLRHNTLRLFDQRQQDVFSIDLVVTIPLNDLCRPLGSFLCSFSKSIKSHHMLLQVN